MTKTWLFIIVLQFNPTIQWHEFIRLKVYLTQTFTHTFTFTILLGFMVINFPGRILKSAYFSSSNKFYTRLFISRKRTKLLVIFKCNLKLNVFPQLDIFFFFSQHTSNLNSDVALRVTRRKLIGRIMLKILKKIKVKKYPII